MKLADERDADRRAKEELEQRVKDMAVQTTDAEATNTKIATEVMRWKEEQRRLIAQVIGHCWVIACLAPDALPPCNFLSLR